MNELLELLADGQHEIWSHWMKYMFTCGERDTIGNWVMPQEKVVRWTTQMETPYSELSEREKLSDREMALRIVSTFREFSEKSE